MKTKKPTYKFIAWSNPEALHQSCIEWIQELEFVKDEQRFLDDLIKNHTLSLISGKTYNNSIALIAQLSSVEKDLDTLLGNVKKHSNELSVLVDDVEEPEVENTFKENHAMIKIQVSRYLSEYRKTKKRIFKLIKRIMKSEKQKRLLK
ncbi:MAG: hypothetical protein HKO54_09645 [Flavobacteriaceae bacterium]|nr:hypothetical protein [Flavobacteriaceae bacterium]